MSRKNETAKPPEAPRSDRLKAALKANMARRKTQAKARDAAGTGNAADTGTADTGKGQGNG
jgi:hypothetical protein